ncbi:hypothetical protein Tco_0452242 [Tanacetum coccineum]
MLAIHAEEGEGSGQPSEPQPTPSPAQSFHEEQLSDIPSSSQPQKTQKHRKGRKLSNRVLDLEKAMTAQAKEIAILKKRVKKLEKRKRSRTQGLKLFKIGTSKRRSLDKEDASKHGRNLNARLISEEDDFDAGFDVVRDEGITHVEGDAEQVVIAAAEVVNAGVSVSTAEPKTPPTTTTTLLEDDEVTVAATLVQMSETSKAKSIVFEDVEESAKEQREGKAPMVEEDVPPPKKTQKQLDDERAGLEEAMRLQAEQEAEHAEQIHLDRLRRASKEPTAPKQEEIEQLIKKFGRQKSMARKRKLGQSMVGRKLGQSTAKEDEEYEKEKEELRDLTTMFHPNEEDDFWKSQEKWNIVSWKLHKSTGVHTLKTDTEMVIHMLVEKKYPLMKKVLLQMLELKLDSENDSTIAMELIKFIKQQI